MAEMIEDFESAPVPVRSAVLSFSALAVPVFSSTVFPEITRDHETLLWLLALVPAFLLAYYRGWRGVAVAMAAGMAVLTFTNLYLLVTDQSIGSWPLLLGVVGSYIGIGIGLGIVSELLHRERERVRMLALYDSLTGAPNRRYADLILERSFGAAQRGMPLVVVLFDVDKFKEYNDRYGHLEGDEALKVFTRVLLQTTRKMNLSARYGGEEFFSIVNDSTVEGALVFVDRVREELAKQRLNAGAITVCTGLAAYDPSMVDPENLVVAADKALYMAKAEGPDTVKVYSRDREEGEEPRAASGAAAEATPR